MVPIEIERKYTINSLPKEVKIEEIKNISQKHLYTDGICSIRVRKSIDMKTKEVICTHTIKTKSEKVQKYSIQELEVIIPETKYDELTPFNGSNVVEKYRCIIPIQNGLKVELDVFQGSMKGLIVAEVEFNSLSQAENFQMPNWFNAEIPHKQFSNRKLSTKTREEIYELIGETQLKINLAIYKILFDKTKIL